MSPIEKGVIRRKLAIIVENLNALEPIKEITKKEYIEDVYKRKATERLLQELIEAAIDINTHIIVQTGNTAPDDYYESFIKAGELKIISADLAEKLAPSAGLRNRLVHEYDLPRTPESPTRAVLAPRISGVRGLIEHSIVLDAVRMAEELYSEYVKEIEDYISGRT